MQPKDRNFLWTSHFYGLFAKNLVVSTLTNWRKIALKDLSVVRSTIFNYAENADESISFKAINFINSLKGGVEINILTPFL